MTSQSQDIRLAVMSLVDRNEDGQNFVVSSYADTLVAMEETYVDGLGFSVLHNRNKKALSHQFSCQYIFFYSEITQINLLVVALHRFQVAKNHKLVGCLSLIHLLFRCIVL